jgi:hypothetical protein
MEYEYDVALSFAGEERDFVESVATHLKQKGVRVFYDRFEEANLWGKDLVLHFEAIYSTKAKYFIPFLSKHYKDKVWTNHELKSALSSAILKNEEYILPARFDDTVIAGVRHSLGYIDLRKHTPESFGQLILFKCGFQKLVHSEDHVEAGKALLSTGLALTPLEGKREVILSLEVTNLSTDNRFFEQPSFHFGATSRLKPFSLLRRDYLGLYPFELRKGEKKSLQYYLDEELDQIWKAASNEELHATILTTLDEHISSNSITVKQIIDNIELRQ